MDKHNQGDVDKAKDAVKSTVANFTGDGETQVEVKPDKVNGAVRPKVDGAKNVEEEIQDVAAFYESPLGKKWASVEPASLQRVYEVTERWGQKWSTDILVRAREEMKKKGVEF